MTIFHKGGLVVWTPFKNWKAQRKLSGSSTYRHGAIMVFQPLAIRIIYSYLVPRVCYY